MKAVILAGGAGTRLRPVSLMRPKPMVRLLDKPLLEHIVVLLRDNGFDEICMTLMYLPKQITDYFGDGREWGVSIDYRTEQTPLGTAGSVKQCASFIGSDDALVISGDAACRLDLRSFAAFHRSMGGEASILLKQCFEPREYGLVICDSTGRVTNFIEKPSSDRIYTDLVNTGIYMLSPSVIKRIPDNTACDFGSELFPAMLAEGARLYGRTDPGYWSDVGSCASYLRTSIDFLPVGRSYVSPGAIVDSGCAVGPNAVIGSGSCLGKGCSVKNSVIDGALLAPNVSADGAVVCAGASVGAGCQLREGCVIGDGVSIGAGSVICEGVRIWPGKVIESGSTVMRSITGGETAAPPVFDADGALRGDAVASVTPRMCMDIGASKSELKRCGAASAGGHYAAMCAEGFLIGCACSGKEAFSLDCVTPATAAFTARVYGFDTVAFFHQQGGRISAYFYDSHGLPISRKIQRALEAACVSETVSADEGQCRSPIGIDSTRHAHIAAAAGICSPLSGMKLAVTDEDGILSSALKQRGAELVPPAGGVIELRLSRDGFSLSAVDEKGAVHDHASLLCALTYCELTGDRRCLCLPYDAPEAAEYIAEALDGRLYRLGRDGDDALEIWTKKPFAQDGIFLAMRICSHLADRHISLWELMSRLPEFHRVENVITAARSAPQIFRQLGRDYPAELVSGMKIKTAYGTVRINAQPKNRIRIIAESRSMEAAGELCAEIISKISDGGK